MGGDTLLAGKKVLLKRNFMDVAAGHTGKGMIEQERDICLTYSRCLRKTPIGMPKYMRRGEAILVFLWFSYVAFGAI